MSATRGNPPPAAGTPLPYGFTIALDPSTRRLDDVTLFGGSSARILKLSPAGWQAWDELTAGPVGNARSGALARRLTDAGAAHPRPPRSSGTPDVTVVIPVRDRASLLDRCLTALGPRYPVVVVDDGSDRPLDVASVAALHGARLVVRAVNGGPAAARNTGVRGIETEFVAFLDSDCEPAGDWITPLTGHFADPLVGAIAPRIVAAGGPGRSARQAITGLDLGRAEALVRPGSSVSYVPTAALLVRRTALPDFDEELRVGEDVDLIWRICETGWRIRYVPTVEVRHHEPPTVSALLRRRYTYGSSAGPLARRHPDAMSPLILHPWPTAAALAVIACKPVLAGLLVAGSAASLRIRLTRQGIPARGSERAMLHAALQTYEGIGRYLTRFAAPAVVAAVLLRRTRPSAAALTLVPPLAAWWRDRSAASPTTFTALRLADDLCYGAGVLRSALDARTAQPVLPKLLRLRLVSRSTSPAMTPES